MDYGCSTMVSFLVESTLTAQGVATIEIREDKDRKLRLIEIGYTHGNLQPTFLLPDDH